MSESTDETFESLMITNRLAVADLPHVHVQGKTSGSAIKVADLTSIHDFGAALSGSVTAYEAPAASVC